MGGDQGRVDHRSAGQGAHLGGKKTELHLQHPRENRGHFRF